MLRYLSNRIAFSDPALKVNLERLESAWEDYQSCRDRDGIYRYLTPVFELVTWWAHGDIAEIYAHRAMCRKAGRTVDHVPEPFAAIILCTADPEKVDYRMRSKWSRALRYAAKFKTLEEPLSDFIKRKGGINRCAARYARRLGRAAHRTSIINSVAPPDFREIATANCLAIDARSALPPIRDMPPRRNTRRFVPKAP